MIQLFIVDSNETSAYLEKYVIVKVSQRTKHFTARYSSKNSHLSPLLPMLFPWRLPQSRLLYKREVKEQEISREVALSISCPVKS
jgi:hypothetical protein